MAAVEGTSYRDIGWHRMSVTLSRRLLTSVVIKNLKNCELRALETKQASAV